MHAEMRQQAEPVAHLSSDAAHQFFPFCAPAWREEDVILAAAAPDESAQRADDDA